MTARQKGDESMAAKRKPEPMRTRITVPQADESVILWFSLQDDHSLSVRQLIRESIQRDGYIDVVNRPVDQQPRRGRPPQFETAIGASEFPQNGESRDLDNGVAAASNTDSAQGEESEPTSHADNPEFDIPAAGNVTEHAEAGDAAPESHNRAPEQPAESASTPEAEQITVPKAPAVPAAAPSSPEPASGIGASSLDAFLT